MSSLNSESISSRNFPSPHTASRQITPIANNRQNSGIQSGNPTRSQLAQAISPKARSLTTTSFDMRGQGNHSVNRRNSGIQPGDSTRSRLAKIMPPIARSLTTTPFEMRGNGNQGEVQKEDKNKQSNSGIMNGLENAVNLGKKALNAIKDAVSWLIQVKDRFKKNDVEPDGNKDRSAAKNDEVASAWLRSMMIFFGAKIYVPGMKNISQDNVETLSSTVKNLTQIKSKGKSTEQDFVAAKKKLPSFLRTYRQLKDPTHYATTHSTNFDRMVDPNSNTQIRRDAYKNFVSGLRTTPPDGTSTESIMTGFRQGRKGNCATVSAIKAAMVKFGQKPGDIFQQVTKSGDGYDIVMKDGFKVHLTEQELQQATRSSGFSGSNAGMLEIANFLYAASVKRTQMERGHNSYAAALRDLETGDWTKDTFRNLGLKNHVVESDVNSLARGQLGIVERDGHSVAVINGAEEIYGRKGGRPNRGHALALV
jgi:hypothetical protein